MPGMPTEPTVQSEAAAFWRWFDGSRVVGQGGAPLLLFHGSSCEDIETINRQDTAYGYFFTPERSAADFYKGNRGGKTYEVYLNARRIADLEDDQVFEAIAREAIDDLDEGPSPDSIREAWEAIGRLAERNPDVAEELSHALKKQDPSDWDIENIAEQLGEMGRTDEATRLRDFMSDAPKVSMAVLLARKTFQESMGQDWYSRYQDDFTRAAGHLGYDCVTFMDAAGGGSFAQSYVVFDSKQILMASPELQLAVSAKREMDPAPAKLRSLPFPAPRHAMLNEGAAVFGPQA